MKNLLEYVKTRAKLSGRQLLSFDKLAEFPAEQVKELEDKGVLFQIKDADGIICTECDKECWKPVETRLKDGKAIGVIYCTDEDCGGLVEVELKRLRRWEITDKIKQYMPKIIPDDPPPPVDYMIELQGKQYILTYTGIHEILPDTFGSKYIVYLLTHKDVDISAFQLEMECKLKPENRPDDPDDVSEGLGQVDHAGDLGKLSEFKPEQMQSAIEHLEQQIEDTDRPAEIWPDQQTSTGENALPAIL